MSKNAKKGYLPTWPFLLFWKRNENIEKQVGTYLFALVVLYLSWAFEL